MPTLVILAAGMASRYGSMKQIQGFGPGGETIMDYSIYDAIRAGFKKVVFIIRRDFADDFKEIFEPRLEGRIKIEYAYQDMDAYTEGYEAPADRSKPWGTAHAVLCTRDVVNEPFAVINADDFYGSHSFQQASDFLQDDCDENNYALVGYDMLNTLSDHGTVNRGVCTLNEIGRLASVVERINISRQGDRVVCDDGREPKELPLNTKVSMNFWCLHPSFYNHTQMLFRQFLQDRGQELKSEFFIPDVADWFIKNEGRIEVLPTSSSWFGVTYKEDAPFVEKSLKELVDRGEYPAKLWS